MTEFITLKTPLGIRVQNPRWADFQKQKEDEQAEYNRKLELYKVQLQAWHERQLIKSDSNDYQPNKPVMSTRLENMLEDFVMEVFYLEGEHLSDEDKGKTVRYSVSRVATRVRDYVGSRVGQLYVVPEGTEVIFFKTSIKSIQTRKKEEAA